jgi:hypothetical protein
MELDWFERAILGFIIFGALALVYFLTEFVIGVTVFLLTIAGLGFVAEKLIDHILEEEN